MTTPSKGRSLRSIIVGQFILASTGLLIGALIPWPKAPWLAVLLWILAVGHVLRGVQLVRLFRRSEKLRRQFLYMLYGRQ